MYRRCSEGQRTAGSSGDVHVGGVYSQVELRGSVSLRTNNLFGVCATSPAKGPRLMPADRRGAQKPRDAANTAEEGQRHAIRSSQRRKGVIAVTEVLLLNASFEPLRLVSVKKAIVLLLQEKAEVVEAA